MSVLAARLLERLESRQARVGVVGLGYVGTPLAAKLASVDYIRLPFAIAAGFLAFGEVPGLWTMLGAAIIVATAIWAAISDHRAPAVEPAATL